MKRISGIIFLFAIVSILNAKTVVDISGRKVYIPDKIKRVIAIGPGALRFICYMKQVKKLVGIERIESVLQKDVLLRPYFYAVKDLMEKLPIIGEGGPGKIPYLERIVKVQPDVIISVGFSGRQIDIIQRKTRIPVVELSYGNLGVLDTKFLKSLKIAGKVFDSEKRAGELIEYINHLIADISKRVRKEKAVKVYVGGVAYKGLHDLTSTDSTFYPFKLLNLKNVATFAKLEGHFFISWERLMLWDPEYIFIDRTSLPLVLKNFLLNPKKYMLISAFKRKKVYVILPYNYYNTNVELVFISSYCLGKTLYPEEFSDIVPEKKFEEITEKFLGTKINPPSDFCSPNFFDIIKRRK